MAWRIQQIDNAVTIRELHDRRRYGNPPLLLQRHPVGRGMAAGLTTLDRPGELDRAAEQQKLFSQRRLAGVGMRNNRKGSPPGDLLLDIGHWLN